MDALARLAGALDSGGVRFVLIGVSGANFYARGGETLFSTQDSDLFLPPESANWLRAIDVCRTSGLRMRAGGEPLGEPVDDQLARQVIERRVLVEGTDEEGFQVDLTLTMTGFDFEEVWAARRTFRVDGVDLPVALLAHIVRSKAAAGRPKDRLFLATHEEALRRWMAEDS